MDKLYELTKEWHKSRKITINGNSQMQTIKLGEEYGELCAAIAKGDKNKLRDSIGDMLVVLTAITELEKLDLKDCWQTAYDEIKDREGVLLPNGNFLKKADWKCYNCHGFIPQLNNFCKIKNKSVDCTDICDNWKPDMKD
jgi:NTP pyrophosphatase (non-canonical NTP hydrolase)